MGFFGEKWPFFGENCFKERDNYLFLFLCSINRGGNLSWRLGGRNTKNGKWAFLEKNGLFGEICFFKRKNAFLRILQEKVWERTELYVDASRNPPFEIIHSEVLLHYRNSWQSSLVCSSKLKL